ncbi:ATP phosphoribosyltransferase [bacterium]|nr:ATP phosphoribosyltransferase [bacterium]
MDGITIALSKGRIFDETLPLLAAAGIEPLENPETSRKLIIPTTRDDVRLVIVRATDAPTYVQYGAADIGVAGKDVLLEHGGDGLYQPLDPLAGLADAIVDLVSTGSTLKANNLVAVEHILDISSRLIVNQAALKLKREKIVPILDAFASVVGP